MHNYMDMIDTVFESLAETGKCTTTLPNKMVSKLDLILHTLYETANKENVILSVKYIPTSSKLHVYLRKNM